MSADPAPAAPWPPEALRRRDADLVEAVWAFFSSPRLTLAGLGALALGCALGAFATAQTQPIGARGAEIGDGWWAPLGRLLELSDPFHSWWFSLLLLTLALNLLASALERLPRSLRIALRPDKRLSAPLLATLRWQRQLALGVDQPEAVGRVARLFRAHGFRPETNPARQGAAAPGGEAGSVFLFAERGRHTVFGVWLSHLGLLLIGAGALWGRLGGAEGFLNAPMDGATFDFLYRKTPAGATFKEPLDFVLRVDGFRLQSFRNGSPRALETDLAVVAEPGTPRAHDLFTQTLRVGEPLSYGGWTFYQAGDQAAPERDSVKLHILDKTTRETRDVTLARDAEVKLGAVTLKAVNYTPNLASVGPAVQLERREGGLETSFWVLQNYPDFDSDNRGDRFGLRFDGLSPFYFTGIQGVKDPGYRWWLFGWVTLCAGLGLALLGSHRRLWARIDPQGQVTVAGVARRRATAFEAGFARLAEELARPLAKPGAV